MQGDTPSGVATGPSVRRRARSCRPAEAVGARRELGVQLAVLRDAARLTQEELARRVGYVRSTVGNVETGRQRVPRRFWIQCDQILATSGVLTEAYDRVEMLERQAALTAATDPPAAVVDAAPWPAPPSADVDPGLVLHWARLLRVLAGVHNLLGPGQVHDAVCRESSLIRRYRNDAVGDLRTGLLAVEARWAEFASWTADNIGDHQAASFWLDRALGLARQAAHGPMTAYVVMRQAQEAADRHDGAKAAALAATAAATAALSDRDRALCAIREAQGHALRGDRRACSTAIKTAYRLIARAGTSGPLNDDPDTIGTHCGLPYVRAHEAYCALRLGRALDAVQILEDVLGSWPQDLRQDEALARAWLAHAYLATHRLAEAGVEADRALALTTTTFSARTTRILAQLDVRLATTPGISEVERFRAAFSLATLARTM
jgi:tetratricopeptide (TPR) repeat protein